MFFFLVCVFIFEGLSASDGKSLRSVLHGTVGKIRFLTLTPSQFAERTAVSQLLSQDEAFAILMNISSPTLALPLPDGFTSSRVARKKIPEPEPEPEQEPFRGPTLFGGSTSSHVSTVVYFKIAQLQVKICFQIHYLFLYRLLCQKCTVFAVLCLFSSPLLSSTVQSWTVQ